MLEKIIYTIRNLKLAMTNDKYRLVKGTMKGFFLLIISFKEIGRRNKERINTNITSKL